MEHSKLLVHANENAFGLTAEQEARLDGAITRMVETLLVQKYRLEVRGYEKEQA